MRPDTTRSLSRVTLAAFGIAGILAAIAVYDYATGVHGGAIVSSLGTIVATLFGVLTE
ncbi:MULTISPECIES: hypothetical protein [Haloarcula]|uniref:Uncharacterized protein n=1 Tax=Haloarcula pellucida TaxID=1427151 RepID=A0A830GG00_9EURY|nr:MULTISPECIES: hypothetical protein [Halomicroarcula]MBX0346798.1 hypothetical protein [Halomicroarcula pellucida]MDS0277324.1 hypothetical protein [Halomicroarcula sp. S1AR25-4]QIO22268.1 hypothetical protein G9465_07920 [Haloarcula sp. JP-L23]GGN85549.1 hypothetical protein GCM10009030_02160 [Halomicroarcula pellucida]